MQNYHCHHSFSNVNTSFKDSAMSYADYAERAKALGQSVITCVDHGTQGNWMRCWETAKKNNLKFVYGVEAYWVKDRHQDDRTNAHIILLAQNSHGIHQLNKMLSTANEDGYYYVPRVDMELLRMLNPSDVFVTTACISFWAKIDRETQEVLWHYGGETNSEDEMLNMFHGLCDHFGESLALEVQCHNTPWQKKVNKLCLDLHYKHKVPLIVGLDSHYIYPEQKIEREWLREESNIKLRDNDHEFENCVYEDYPDEATVINRLRDQGVLNEQEIRDAIDTTDLLLFFDDIELDRSRKLPTIYPELTQEQRNQKYLDLISEKWAEYKQRIPQEDWQRYEDSFYREEANIVVETNTSDYFLIDYEIVKRGKEKGGMITPSGRGSSGSWFTNTLLGFSTLDRFKLPVKLYPPRFCTKERLLTGMPDLDMNLDNPEIFANVQEELLGHGHSYQMISYGTLQYKSAFKMLARAKGLPADIANMVTKQIDRYEIDRKNADDDDERELIRIEDYVSDEYLPYIEESAVYRGIVVSKAPSPCSYLLYNGDIRSEIGIMRVNAKQGKKIVYCTVVDGYTADDFGYVKNDLLTVKVISINAEAMRRAKLPQYTSDEIIRLTENDAKTWAVFSNGYTQGINQCQGKSTTDKLGIYKSKSLLDLSAFVAAIRPGFKSMVQKFLRREMFKYGIPSFDALLQNDSTGSSWLLYQEDIMTVLGLAGFEMAETYPIIKAISKKKQKIISAAEERFLKNFAAHIVQTERSSKEAAHEVAQKVWKIIIDSASYSFNASHSVAVSIDALYGAYLKANYPLEYYSTLLDNYADSGNKNKVSEIKTEMRKAYQISVVPCRFRQDNRKFYIDHDKKQISDSLNSVKYIGKPAVEALYQMRNEKFDSFIDVLIRLDNHKAFDKRVILALIRMGYFEEFGARKKLLTLYEEFTSGKNRITKSLVDRTRMSRRMALVVLERSLPNEDLPVEEQLAFEAEYCGMPLSVFPNAPDYYVVTEIETKYSPKVNLYSAKRGTSGVAKILKRDYQETPIYVGDIIQVLHHQKKLTYSYVDGKRVPITGTFDLWVDRYAIIYRHKEQEEES